MIIKRIACVVVALLIFVWLATYLSLAFEQHEYLEITPLQRQEAQDFWQGKYPPIPDSWHWQRYTAAPGVELRGGYLSAENAKGTVIVVPGFTVSTEMLTNEIHHFHSAGYNVSSIEYRGQGDSYRPLANPEKGYVEDYSVLANEVHEFAKSVREPNKPLFFYSTSKGAHITMRMAAELTPDVAAYALTVPMIKLYTADNNYNFIRQFSNILNSLGLGKMYAPGSGGYKLGGYGEAIPCNRNPERANAQNALFALKENLRTRGITVKWLHETFNSTEKLMTPSYTKGITQPVKLITAGIDVIVDSDAAKQFCDSLADCENIHVESARHCLAEEDIPLYKDLLAQVTDFFDKQLPANEQP